MATQRIISPIDGSVVAERETASATQIDAVLSAAVAARASWRATAVEDRVALCERVVENLLATSEEVGAELTRQMGRPVSQSPNEIRRGFQERARHMMSIAPNALADRELEPREGFTRFIRRDPVGTVLLIAPWNYPYLCAVNSIIPALLAGNTAVLKMATQTLLCAERLAAAFAAAGAPDGLFQYVHATHDDVAQMIGDERIDFVAFTGSVEAGHRIQAAASTRFIGTGLELGGKDPAYVRADADLAYTVGETVDGSFFNSGQSCCGIERIYVHEAVFDDFVDGFAATVRQYRLGDPLDPATNLGPMVSASAADFVRRQIADAVAAGARQLVGEGDAAFSASRPGTAYLAPTVLVDVNHSMDVMVQESFGPVVGIQRVSSDDEAVALMNDSPYGLTASIWSADEQQSAALGDRVATGTFYVNRCDYLDPALAWTGVKDTGRGITLSEFGFDAFVRPKSFHVKHLP
jgi:acyl-CoA reductase-like NAD-dependent aldehyde dehydrogenase